MPIDNSLDVIELRNGLLPQQIDDLIKRLTSSGFKVTTQGHVEADGCKFPIGHILSGEIYEVNRGLNPAGPYATFKEIVFAETLVHAYR